VTGNRPIRIANCSGFFGDRLSAAREMVEGGDIDVLTGDWLAELTMLILHKQRARNSEVGYASTFLTQMEQVLAPCIERGIKIVSNAGGLSPAGCAERVRQIAARLGIEVSVAHIEGDDLLARVDDLRSQLTNLDTGEPLTATPVTANAYLGGWGVAAALHSGADVVICPRITDASLVVGPAAWWWNWRRDQRDALAGAVVAGHIIECGAQATGGNYSFFDEIPDLSSPPGFPLAEIDHDGSSIITKHAGTGGLVSVGTVTAQLLYEIGGRHYLNPDVVADFATIHLDDDGPDRVRVHGVRGLPAPPTTKVAINYDGGHRNRMTFVLTGLHQAEKAKWAESALFARLGGKDRFDEVDVTFTAAPSDAAGQEASSGRLHVTVKSSDERVVGRAFSSAVVELALANYPGFFVSSQPTEAQPFGVYWPALVANDEVHQEVVLADGSRQAIEGAPMGTSAPSPPPATPVERVAPSGPQPGQPLGEWFGARSGDKGGNANLGIWAGDAAGYAWLVENLTADTIPTLIPEASGLTVHRYELPNLLALNFVIVGYLGEGVASSTAFDPQAKGLGEYLRSRPAPSLVQGSRR
jgi:Acyclic terpene utilisation family protein AtuA